MKVININLTINKGILTLWWNAHDTDYGIRDSRVQIPLAEAMGFANETSS